MKDPQIDPSSAMLCEQREKEKKGEKKKKEEKMYSGRKEERDRIKAIAAVNTPEGKKGREEENASRYLPAREEVKRKNNCRERGKGWLRDMLLYLCWKEKEKNAVESPLKKKKPRKEEREKTRRDN